MRFKFMQIEQQKQSKIRWYRANLAAPTFSKYDNTSLFSVRLNSGWTKYAKYIIDGAFLALFVRV